MKNIGRYIIRGLLGRGGMGKVYKVELPVIGKIAALKLLDPDPLVERLMGRDSIRAIFEKEAATMAALSHPNIVAINDYDQARGKLFYVMDYFANSLGTLMGETFTVETHSRPIPVDKAIDYTRQSLDGIGCLHDAGIFHRDIKPYNLLVTHRDTIKICDFGLSKLRGETYAGPGNLKVGSPYYAAPEQENDPDHVDERADLYPVGIILYRILSGSLPDIKPDRSGYRPLAAHNPDLDGRWDAFIQQAAAYDPTERFASAKAMLTALDHLEKHWLEKKELSCRLQTEAPERPNTTRPAQLRQKPAKFPPAEAARHFKVDALWRPMTYSRGDFLPLEAGTILDRSTGLLWQQSGSDYPRSWEQAKEYVRKLNDAALAGRNTWRMPTIDELITLLSPVPQGQDLCIAPVFNAIQKRLWSADRRSFMAGYYVDVELGFVGWQDFSAPYHVRAVSGSAK